MEDNYNQRRLESFDVDKFAALVKTKESIWNYKCRAYANKQQRRDDWMSVCEDMIPDFRDKTNSEKGAIVLELQTKWRVLRDGYTRSLKNYNKKLGSGSRGKLYLYYEQLHFLQDLYGSIQLSRQNTPTGSSSHKITKKRKRQRPNVAEMSDDSVDGNVSETRVPEKSNNSNLLTEHVDEQTFEEDKQFLLSLLADFRKIPEDQKLDAKGDIINVIRHYRNKSTHFETRGSYYTNDIAALATTATDGYFGQEGIEDGSRESGSPIEIKFNNC